MINLMMLEILDGGTHLVIRHANDGDGIGVGPDIVFCELHALLLEILAAIAELFPLLLPFGDGILERTCKVGEFAFVGVDCLLRTFKFKGDALEVLALDEGALGSVGVNAETILLVFLPSLVDVAFLCLFCFELFLDRSLITFAMLGLTGDERGSGVFELVADLLGEL